MLSLFRAASVSLMVWSLLTGLAYPALVTAFAQLLFPAQANGSLVVASSGKVLGSSLVGQPFDAPGYFWSRPSATAKFPYDASASTGSNLGPSTPALGDAVKARVQALRAADPAAVGPVPVDLVTSSGSGLDPHLSPQAALYQVHRVALARGLDEARVRTLVEARVEGRSMGVLGEPRVNVLGLNAALDALAAPSDP
jgi:potassium-transporting ATPase KdpC subunit